MCYSFRLRREPIMRKAVILQSSYIPWKGYFDLIRYADVFVFLDDVQYTKSDWRSRNKIKTDQGVLWLTIPAGTNLHLHIDEVEIHDQRWKAKHQKTIEQYYRRSKFYDANLLSDLYENNITNLSVFNQRCITQICRKLKIECEFVNSRDLGVDGEKTERLVKILQAVEAGEYMSGPSARNYIKESQFRDAGIKLRYADYSGYREYPQLYGEFAHEVTMLDLIFNVGSVATFGYMKDF